MKISALTIRCVYCGLICQGTGTRDHVYPKNRGGTLGPKGENLAKACRTCNQAKGNMTVEEFMETDYYRKNCASGRWRGVVLK